MRIIILIIVSALIVGCAGSPLMIEVPNIAQSESVQVQDIRPASEKESEIFSYMITSEAYGTYRRGDELISPDPVRLFQHRLYEKYSDQPAIPQAKIHHLVMYMNLQSELRRSSLGAGFGGIVGAAVASGTQKYGIDGIAKLISQEEFESFEEEYKRALYTKEENPEKVSVYRVFLEAELNGKRVFVSTMTPTRLPEGSDRNPHVAALETAIAYALDQF